MIIGLCFVSASVRTLINSNKEIKIAWKVLKFEEKVFYTPDHLDPVKE